MPSWLMLKEQLVQRCVASILSESFDADLVHVGYVPLREGDIFMDTTHGDVFGQATRYRVQ